MLSVSSLEEAFYTAYIHTIKRCTQPQPSGCILGASCDCINLRLKADIVLQLLSYVAETERDFIRQRQAEVIAAAKARGIHMGRPRTARSAAFEECARLWSQGLISARAASKRLGISHTTFLIWVRE